MTESTNDYTVAELDILDALRMLDDVDYELLEPPNSVWSGVEVATTATGQLISLPTPQRLNVSPHESVRRTQRRAKRVAVAAGIVAVLAGSAIPLLRSQDGDTTRVIASAELSSDGLGGPATGLLGTAEVSQEGSEQVLRVEIGDLGPADGAYLELWLIRPDISGMVSLGAVRADGNYQLPAGIRLDEYSIVDVSTEPYDGDPAHSGNSLLRGMLNA